MEYGNFIINQYGQMTGYNRVGNELQGRQFDDGRQIDLHNDSNGRNLDFQEIGNSDRYTEDIYNKNGKFVGQRTEVENKDGNEVSFSPWKPKTPGGGSGVSTPITAEPLSTTESIA